MLALRIDASVGQLRRIREAVREAADSCGCSAECTADVVMAVDEACQNVIRHAYRGDPSGAIELEIERRGEDLVISLRDFAREVDPALVQAGWIIAVCGAVFMGMTVLYIVRTDRIIGLLGRLTSVVPSGILRRACEGVARRLEVGVEGLHALKKPRLLVGIIITSLVYLCRCYRSSSRMNGNIFYPHLDDGLYMLAFRLADQFSVFHDDIASNYRAYGHSLYFPAIERGNRKTAVQFITVDNTFLVHIDDRKVPIRTDLDRSLAGVKIK